MNSSWIDRRKKRLEGIGVCPTCHWPLDECMCMEAVWLAFIFMLILLLETWKFLG